MNMQDVDKVIAEILTGGNSSAVAAVPEVTGGKSRGSRRSHSRKSRSGSHHSKHHHVAHHGGTLTIGKLKPIMIRGGEEPLQGGSVIDSLFGGEAPAEPVAPEASEVISGGSVSIKAGSKAIKAGSKAIKAGAMGGEITGAAASAIVGGSTAEPAPPAEPISGGESSDLEGGKKRSHKKRSHKKKLPEALARKKSMVMNIYEELKESKKYKKMPGNMLLKKAMEMSRGK